MPLPRTATLVHESRETSYFVALGHKLGHGAFGIGATLAEARRNARTYWKRDFGYGLREVATSTLQVQHAGVPCDPCSAVANGQEVQR